MCGCDEFPRVVDSLWTDKDGNAGNSLASNGGGLGSRCGSGARDDSSDNIELADEGKSMSDS
jgi:hypothetical protein